MSQSLQLLRPGAVDPEWEPLLIDALGRLNSNYQQQLLETSDWLPGIDALFNAFKRDLKGVRYLLIAESPYPRPESANGIAFHDAAISTLWSERGLSRAVNRATSLRNILKTALRAESRISPDKQGKITQAAIAGIDKSMLVQTMEQLSDNFHKRGFLMLNATPVLHPQRKATQEARYWADFLERLLVLLAESLDTQITLVLWGKIAQRVETLAVAQAYQKIKSPHPYNLSFIDHPNTLALFRKLSLLSMPGDDAC